MENKEHDTQTMTEWDKQVCARLDDLWNRHHSGELELVDMDVAFAKARAIVNRSLAEQNAQREVTVQSFNNAV